jgi:hypothetical protein
MVGRLAAGGVALALALAPAPGPGAAAAEPIAAAAAGHGAIVVAISDEAGPPARSLGREVYRDAALRPAIDEATARVLAGEGPSGEPAKAKLTEMAEIRAAIAGASAEAASRRLIASLGAETGAALVITVAMDAGRPVAKVLQVSSATYARIELGATIETAPDGTRSFQWPGATATLKGLLPPAAPRPAPAAAPKVTAPPPRPVTPKESKPVWASPWFWGTIGGVAAAGITVFVLSRVTATPSTVHLDGRVAP